MITIFTELNKKGNRWEASLVIDENGTEKERFYFGKIKLSDPETIKTTKMGIGGGGLTVGLKVLNGKQQAIKAMEEVLIENIDKKSKNNSKKFGKKFEEKQKK